MKFCGKRCLFDIFYSMTSWKRGVHSIFSNLWHFVEKRCPFDIFYSMTLSGKGLSIRYFLFYKTSWKRGIHSIFSILWHFVEKSCGSESSWFSSLSHKISFRKHCKNFFFISPSHSQSFLFPTLNTQTLFVDNRGVTSFRIPLAFPCTIGHLSCNKECFFFCVCVKMLLL